MRTYEHILNKDERTATVRLYGAIGTDVDGNSLAHLLAELGDSPDIDIIQLRINSGGGSVFDGMSIVSAIRSSQAVTHCYVDGIAASMAAVIAVSGDKLYMMDYAKLMIHDPYFSGGDTPGPKEQKALTSLTDMLQTLLSRKGIGKEDIAKLMKEETWFSAEEAKAKHLADGIIPSQRKQELSALSTEELLARITNEYKPSKTKRSMNEIAKLLGLPEDATEQQIMDKIKERETAMANLQESVIAQYVSMGEKNGIITEKNRERMVKLAKTDFSLFVELVSVEPAPARTNVSTGSSVSTVVSPQGRLSDAISQLGKSEKSGSPRTGQAKTWDWYQKHNPDYLNRLEKENPEAFNRLLDEYENSL